MPQYIIRLDDACEKRDMENWTRMEALLDKFDIKPIVGIIPHCEDMDMEQYPVDTDFWRRAKAWQDKGWVMALHGYTHVFCTTEGGVNPVNHYSEFAGVPREVQKEKIANGVQVFKEHGIEPKIFFAPAHTFDENTVEALKECSDIRTISDTVANDVYCGMGGLTYIPQQSGRVRKLPFTTVTFCYHPNIMSERDFAVLEQFFKDNQKNFSAAPLFSSERQMNALDKLLAQIYFLRRKS